MRFTSHRLTPAQTALALLIFTGMILYGATPGVTDTCTSFFSFVTTTDYSTGSSSVIEFDGIYTTHKNVAAIHSDAVARYYNGYIYVLNRSGADNIQILDPCDNFSTVRQFSTGNGSNPQDIAFVSPGKIYVTRYESNTMWIMNSQTGVQTGSVDFSSFADADGLCEMHQMFMIDDYLFVTVQRIDRTIWTPAGTSYMAVIDVTTDTFVDTDPVAPGTQAIALVNTNPYSEVQFDPWTGHLYVGCAGYWGLLDGGVEIVDPVTLTTSGTMFGEAGAQGDIFDVEIIDDNIGYCLIQNTSYNTDLVSFNPSTGTKIQTVYSPGAWVLQDIDLAPTGDLFLTDRTAVNPGIRIYDAGTGVESGSSPIDVDLPPFDITFSLEPQTAATGPSPRVALGQNYPNPFNPSTTIPFSLERDARVMVEIFDVAGAWVATLLDEVRPAGGHEVRWNGRDDAARPVATGVYFVRLTALGDTRVTKAVLLK